MSRPAQSGPSRLRWSESRRFIGSGGITLAADTCGDPAAPPVLLLHGWGQTRHAWGDTLRELGDRGWHAISLDLRGHGESDWPEDGSYGLEDFARDLLVVIDQLPAPPALVGASLGGISSLLVTTLREEPVASRLVLVDITPRVEAAGAWRVLEFMRQGADGFDTPDDAASAVADYLPHRRRPASAEGLQRNLRRTEDGRYRWHWDPRFLEDPWFAPKDVEELERVTARTRERLLDVASRLEIPTLLVHGRLSDIVTDDTAQEFLDIAPNAAYVDVSGAGHMVAGDVNDAFTEAVITFLREGN